MWGRGLSFTALGVSACLGVATGCGGGASDAATTPARPRTPVHVETLSTKQFEATLVVPGIVEPRARISLGFRIDGFIARLEVDEGDRVEVDEVIAALDLGDLAREVRMARVGVVQAEAHAAEAKLLFDRQQDLYEARSASQQVFDQARLAWEAARAENASAALRLEAAEDRLSKGVLRAPIAGYVEQRLIEEHEAATAGQPVFVLTALDTITVRAAVADTAISRLHVGDGALVRSAAWPGRVFDGTIARIHVTADPVSRTCPFEVTVPNPDAVLMPETVVELEMSMGRSAPVLTVPLGAVLHDAAAQPFCYAVVPDAEADRVERRVVALGPVHGERVAVTAGLAPGDRIVTRGQHFLGDGDAVRVVAD